MNNIVRSDVILSDNIAIRDDLGREISYRELYHRSEHFAKLMGKRGLVFILCDHHIETLAFIYEALTQNMVPLLLGRDIPDEFLDNYINIFCPSYIYCRTSHAIAGRYSHLEEMESHVLLSTNEEKIYIHQDVALLMCTSGTTGSSKLVKLSYENLYNNSEYFDLNMDMRAGQKGITPLPINYTYGFAFHLWHWHCGATMLTTEHLILSREFDKFCSDEKINHFAAVPINFQMLNRIEFWNRDKQEQLHWAMSGGAQMSDEEQKKMISILGRKFWIGYGQTECTCFISGTNFDEKAVKLGTVGKALDDINMNIYLDEETGELIVKGTSVCMGYASCVEQLGEGDINGGILHTGDVAYMDEDGYIFLKGRVARFVKILGKRISLDEIEKYLNKIYTNIEFACIGTDEKIEVYFAADDDKSGENINALLCEKFKIPRKSVFCCRIDEIPRNESGKIQYINLKGN